MSMQVIVTRDFDHMSEVAAERVVGELRRIAAVRPDFGLGLATGNSPTGLYKHLAKAANAGRFDAAAVTSFNLDEYIGLPGENAQQRALHRESYSYFMIRELFGLLRVPFRETNVPWGTLIDQGRLEAEMKAHSDDWALQGADRGQAVMIRPDARSEYLRWIRRDLLDAYAEKIGRRGGLDLHIVGVGGRGHVGFHEAGIPFEGQRMLLVKMDDNTVDNAVADGHFASRAESPRYAVSMGAELICTARTIVLVATGPRKAGVVAEALRMAPDCAVPISYGHAYVARGGRMIYVLDRAAAAEVLAQADEIQARGIELIDRSDERAAVPVAALQFSRDPATGRLG